MALVEEISAVVLDGGEPLSFRSLGTTAQVAAAASCAALEQFARDHREQVDALHVTVERASSVPSSDPRSRVIRLCAAPSSDDAVLSRQVYALYRKQQDAGDSERLATACWAQERQARRDVFAQVAKHAPMSRALKALYASGISCPEATARTEFGDEQGEETVSAFDAIEITKKSAPSTGFFTKPGTASSSSSSSKPAASSTSSSSSSSFFKSSASTASKAKSSTASAPARVAARAEPEVKKVSAESMSNVLSIDSSDEDGSYKEDTDAPVFVKKTSAKTSRSKRVISDDDEDMEDAEEAAKPKPTKRDDSGSHSTKRKLQKEPSPPSPLQSSESEDKSPSKKSRTAAEEPDAPIVVPITRRVLVNKTRITPEGYMVTEKTYEEKALTPEEIESERQAALKKQRLAAKASKSASDKASASGGGSRKQKDLRSFFIKK